jgi:hypothetical protein
MRAAFAFATKSVAFATSLASFQQTAPSSCDVGESRCAKVVRRMGFFY